MADSTVQAYDIIGDVHGCATELEALLGELGYEIAEATGEYRHPDRQAIFVGDLIDRGTEHLRVLEVVKAMVDAGSAQIVMGNHEFNALAYHTEWPLGSGEYLRSRTQKHTEQHQAFLDQLTGEQQREYLDWFATFPLWLDLDGLRVIHACWHDESIAEVLERCGSAAPFADRAHLEDANDETDPLYRAIENLLKGPEISLVDRGYPAYKDKGGHTRPDARTRWWDSEARTLRDIAVMDGIRETVDGDPYPELPDVAIDATSYTYTGKVPVFYGHYWRQGDPEVRRDWTERTACVDFSAVKGGALTAYRWSGEAVIDSENYHQLQAHWDIPNLALVWDARTRAIIAGADRLEVLTDADRARALAVLSRRVGALASGIDDDWLVATAFFMVEDLYRSCFRQFHWSGDVADYIGATAGAVMQELSRRGYVLHYVIANTQTADDLAGWLEVLPWVFQSAGLAVTGPQLMAQKLMANDGQPREDIGVLARYRDEGHLLADQLIARCHLERRSSVYLNLDIDDDSPGLALDVALSPTSQPGTIMVFRTEPPTIGSIAKIAPPPGVRLPGVTIGSRQAKS